MVLLKLFDDYVIDDMRAIYKAVNAVLVENSILPKIRSAGRQGRGKGSAAEKLESVAPAGDSVPGGEQDFFSVLQNLVASNLKARTATSSAGGTDVVGQGAAALPGRPAVAGMPAAGAEAQGGHAVLESAELLQSLTRIQLGDAGAARDGNLPRLPATGEPDTTNVLREFKASSLGAGMNQMDAMTLDIVALLFDQLFDDPKIPLGVKGLIGRLQIPMLKVAIADKTFFSRKSHPARQMLDTLGELSSRLPADVNASNPLFGRLESNLQALMDGFEDNIEIFVVVRERLQTLIAEEDRRVEQETQTMATQMEQKESLALAKTVAQAEIKVRIRDRMVPRPVIEFLVQQWIKLLLVIQVKDGEDSDAWKNALETIDLLISSVEPKDTQEERRKLVTMVPELLKRLTDGLKVAGVEDAVRLGFFAEMRKLHSEIMGKTERPKAPAPLEASLADNTAQPELPPVDVPSVELPLVAEIAPASMEESRQEPPSPAAPEVPMPFDLPLVAEPAPAPKEAVRPAPAPPVNRPDPSVTKVANQAPVNFNAAVTINNPFGQGEVQVDDLDFTTKPAAGTARAKQDAGQANPAENLTPGTWVAIHAKGEKDAPRLAKLSYVSPLKSRFLFVDRNGKTTLECTRTELVRRFQLGELVITEEVPEPPLFDRLAEGLVGKLGGPKAPR